MPQAVRSTGIEPELLVAPPGRLLATVVETVARLLESVEGTIGVIGAPSGTAALAGAVERAALPGADRVAVITSLQSKGLEYDAVLVVEPDRIVAESPGGTRSLYVALTRPTQRLVTVDAGPAAYWRESLE